MTRKLHSAPGFLTTAFTLCCIAVLVGCKAKPAKDVGFADAKLMKKDASLPFHKAWEKPGVDRTKYKVIYVAPVNTEYMLLITNWQKGERRNEIEKDVANLGTYAQKAIVKAFTDDKNHRFTVVESRPKSRDAIILEMALIEVVPSKVTLNALGYAPFFIGMTLSAARAVGGDFSSAAFEARVRDAATNEIIALYADRESEQAAAISVRGLTWYSHAETIIRQWAVQFVQIAKRDPGQKIKDTDPFTLMPW